MSHHDFKRGHMFKDTQPSFMSHRDLRKGPSTSWRCVDLFSIFFLYLFEYVNNEKQIVYPHKLSSQLVLDV